MFVERKVHYSALFTNLVVWHTGTVSFPLSDIILAQIVCPLSDIMFCLHSGITNLSLYKYCLGLGCYGCKLSRKMFLERQGAYLEGETLKGAPVM